MRANGLKSLPMLAALLLGTGMAVAGTAPTALPQSDEAIAKEVRHEVLVYPHYTIFDNITFRVNQGNVELLGAVTDPYKKSGLGKTVERLPGVTAVRNEIEVLPLSNMDNGLRLQLARAIYRDPSLSTLGLQALPPIHIIVDNGHVTLEGVVNTQLQKQVAGMRASSTGLSFGPVMNNLRVENPPAHEG
jgi:hyperosmotically inducible periplasmic protein